MENPKNHPGRRGKSPSRKRERAELKNQRIQKIPTQSKTLPAGASEKLSDTRQLHRREKSQGSDRPIKGHGREDLKETHKQRQE